MKSRQHSNKEADSETGWYPGPVADMIPPQTSAQRVKTAATLFRKFDRTWRRPYSEYYSSGMFWPLQLSFSFGAATLSYQAFQS
jgi:hypothetical protein